MPVAYCLVPDGNYQHDMFAAGLKRAGFTVSNGPRLNPGDIFIIWNRMPRDEAMARSYEAVGCKVVVIENGWVNSSNSERQFAICLGHHNGAGDWPVGNENRWKKLGIRLKPWRKTGEHILVLPQRGIGEPGVAMPEGWTQDIMTRLRASTGRPVSLRQHPGRARPAFDLDFDGCWAAVVWASSAGIKAIIAGIPVFHELPNWIGAGAATLGIDNLEHPFLGDRLPMLKRMAYAQWSADEIISGEPFLRLLK